MSSTSFSCLLEWSIIKTRNDLMYRLKRKTRVALNFMIFDVLKEIMTSITDNSFSELSTFRSFRFELRNDKISFWR